MSTKALTPKTSLSKINSCRMSVHVWPVLVRKLIAALFALAFTTGRRVKH